MFAIRVSPTDDLIGEARTNVQTPEIEILLYDIYVSIMNDDRSHSFTTFVQAENENNPMAEHRRILSLMRWKEWLQQDIESYRRIKDSKFSQFICFHLHTHFSAAEMRSSTLSQSSSGTFLLFVQC